MELVENNIIGNNNNNNTNIRFNIIKHYLSYSIGHILCGFLKVLYSGLGFFYHLFTDVTRLFDATLCQSVYYFIIFANGICFSSA